MTAPGTAWRWLTGLPRILYVALFAASLLGGGVFSIYRYGRMVEQRAQARSVRADSVRAAVRAHRTTSEHTDTVRALAKVADHASDRGRVKYRALRAQAEPEMASWPPLAVELVQAADQQITRDSVTITAHVAVDTAWVAERAAAAEESRQRMKQVVELEHEPKGGNRLLWFAVGVGTTLAATITLLAHR